MPRSYILIEDRRIVIERAEGRCEYCQCWATYATQSFDVDHIIPISRNGLSSIDNLAYACSGCNRYKFNHLAGFDPVEGIEVPLFHPRQMRWSEHFGWNEDYTLLIGLTPTWRATIDMLHLNREGVVNLRKLLRLAGKHPPALSPTSKLP